MYENYLLSPEAIASVLTESGHEVGAAAVRDCLERHRASLDGAGEQWLPCAHGAKLLEAVFDELSNGREPYRKLPHGEKLTRWLLEHDPEQLREVADVLEQFLPVR